MPMYIWLLVLSAKCQLLCTLLCISSRKVNYIVMIWFSEAYTCCVIIMIMNTGFAVRSTSVPSSPSRSSTSLSVDSSYSVARKSMTLQGNLIEVVDINECCDTSTHYIAARDIVRARRVTVVVVNLLNSKFELSVYGSLSQASCCLWTLSSA